MRFQEYLHEGKSGTKMMVANRKFSNWARGQNLPGAWLKIWEYQGKDIGADLPLTDKAAKHWKTHKDTMGVAAFRGHKLSEVLSIEDLKSIISAAKRGEANMYINRMGEVIGYKLKEHG